MTMITLPKRGRGRPSAKAQAIYDVKVGEFCQGLLKIQSGLDFKASAQGWCYILEEYGLLKAECRLSRPTSLFRRLVEQFASNGSLCEVSLVDEDPKKRPHRGT